MEMMDMTGGANQMLEPTPEMAGLEAIDQTLMEKSVPNPYAYQPKPYETYTPEGYQQLIDAKTSSGLLRNPTLPIAGTTTEPMLNPEEEDFQKYLRYKKNQRISKTAY
jgi:hypothetical protein